MPHKRKEALLRRRVYTAYAESGGEGSKKVGRTVQGRAPLDTPQRSSSQELGRTGMGEWKIAVDMQLAYPRYLVGNSKYALRKIFRALEPLRLVGGGDIPTSTGGDGEQTLWQVGPVPWTLDGLGKQTRMNKLSCRVRLRGPIGWCIETEVMIRLDVYHAVATSPYKIDDRQSSCYNQDNMSLFAEECRIAFRQRSRRGSRNSCGRGCRETPTRPGSNGFLGACGAVMTVYPTHDNFLSATDCKVLRQVVHCMGHKSTVDTVPPSRPVLISVLAPSFFLGLFLGDIPVMGLSDFAVALESMFCQHTAILDTALLSATASARNIDLCSYRLIGLCGHRLPLHFQNGKGMPGSDVFLSKRYLGACLTEASGTLEGFVLPHSHLLGDGTVVAAQRQMKTMCRFRSPKVHSYVAEIWPDRKPQKLILSSDLRPGRLGARLCCGRGEGSSGRVTGSRSVAASPPHKLPTSSRPNRVPQWPERSETLLLCSPKLLAGARFPGRRASRAPSDRQRGATCFGG
ncbi:hypothetical protein B0T21DRAFT_392129 [Apiosordaria backusii]|uniref:Uncharacterized protein n=1 Tax=Apiosordaria backusii TaxID=314023 RepID=A0AA40ED10_9PEZI|nr:hypothetical protein B0T21DRAFT_392129 [Apiosordaria backusii]